MIPLTENPTVVVLIDPNEKLLSVKGVATNVSPDLNVVVVFNKADFDEAAKGRPFVDEIN